MSRLISVITVNRNDASGLRATVRSVVAQERPPDQWLVVDGGSTDGSIQVIRQFEPWIESWSSAPDRGVYDGMNQGLRRARGQYVIFMNAGDRFARPDTLARIVATLRSRPDVDLLFGGTILALPSGRRIYRPPHAATRIRHGLPAYHQATVIRRAPHLMAPYDLALPISAEYGTVATLISRGATSAPARPADRDPRLPQGQSFGTGDAAALRRLRDGAASGARPAPFGGGGACRPPGHGPSGLLHGTRRPDAPPAKRFLFCNINKLNTSPKETDRTSQVWLFT